MRGSSAVCLAIVAVVFAISGRTRRAPTTSPGANSRRCSGAKARSESRRLAPMADELELHYFAQGTPDTVMAGWRQQPPEALHGYEVADESFNSLVFEHHYYDWIWKLMWVLTFGVALLFKGFARSVYRVTARFDAEGGMRTKVTIIGKAD